MCQLWGWENTANHLTSISREEFEWVESWKFLDMEGSSQDIIVVKHVQTLLFLQL